MIKKIKLIIQFVVSLLPSKQVKIVSSVQLRFYKRNCIKYLGGYNFAQFHFPAFVKVGVPKGDYYVANVSNTSITLIADNYGAYPNNKFMLKGIYGEGPILILTKNLPIEVSRFFRNMQHMKLRGSK